MCDHVTFDEKEVTLLLSERPVSMSIAWSEITSIEAIAVKLPQGMLRVLTLSTDWGGGLEIHQDSRGYPSLIDELCRRFHINTEWKLKVASVVPGEPVRIEKNSRTSR